MSDFDPDQMMKVLSSELESKNTITLLDFAEFVPLFKSSERESISDDEYSYLEKKWRTERDLYSPIYIVESTEGEDGSRKLIAKLPPAFTPVSTLNKSSDKDCAVIGIFQTAVENDSIISTRAEQSLDLMSMALLEATRNEASEKVKYMEEYTELTTAIVDGSTIEDSPSNIEDDEFDWE